MKKQLIITVETDEQADQINQLIQDAETDGDLDFAFNVERKDADDDDAD